MKKRRAKKLAKINQICARNAWIDTDWATYTILLYIHTFIHIYNSCRYIIMVIVIIFNVYVVRSEHTFCVILLSRFFFLQRAFFLLDLFMLLRMLESNAFSSVIQWLAHLAHNIPEVMAHIFFVGGKPTGTHGLTEIENKIKSKYGALGTRQESNLVYDCCDHLCCYGPFRPSWKKPHTYEISYVIILFLKRVKKAQAHGAFCYYDSVGAHIRICSCWPPKVDEKKN